MVWWPRLRQGGVLRCTIDRSGAGSADLRPIYIDAAYRPAPLARSEGNGLHPLDEQAYRRAVRRTSGRSARPPTATRRSTCGGIRHGCSGSSLPSRSKTRPERSAAGSEREMNNAFGAMYAASPVWLQHILLSAYGLRLRFLRYGRLQRPISGAATHPVAFGGAAPRAATRTPQHTGAPRLRHRSLYRSRSTRYHQFTELEQLQELPVLTKDELRAPRSIVTSALWAAVGRRKYTPGHDRETVDHLL